MTEKMMTANRLKNGKAMRLDGCRKMEERKAVNLVLKSPRTVWE